MDIHIAVADLPGQVQVVAERTPGDLYLVVAQGLSQIYTAVAVADVVGKAFGLDVNVPHS